MDTILRIIDRFEIKDALGMRRNKQVLFSLLI